MTTILPHSVSNRSPTFTRILRLRIKSILISFPGIIELKPQAIEANRQHPHIQLQLNRGHIPIKIVRIQEMVPIANATCLRKKL